jgi:hypothetical protein
VLPALGRRPEPLRAVLIESGFSSVLASLTCFLSAHLPLHTQGRDCKSKQDMLSYAGVLGTQTTSHKVSAKVERTFVWEIHP